MNTFPLTVATPDGSQFQGEAEMLSLRGSEGDLAVMAGHIPLITAVRPGRCVLDLPDGVRRIGHTEGGLLTVAAEGTTLLAGDFRWEEEAT